MYYYKLKEFVGPFQIIVSLHRESNTRRLRCKDMSQAFQTYSRENAKPHYSQWSEVTLYTISDSKQLYIV